MLGSDGEQKLLFSAGRKKVIVGRQGGINTLRSRSATATFEISEPPGKIPEPPGTGDFSRMTWEQSGTSGKNSEVLGKKFSRLRHLADRSFVAGIILVLEQAFKHLVSSMPLLVSLLIVRLVLYSNSK
jgi:hypothetical protein